MGFIVNCVCFDNKVSPLSKQIGLSMACVVCKILLTGQFVVLGHILSYIRKMTLSLNKWIVLNMGSGKTLVCARRMKYLFGILELKLVCVVNE